MYGPAAGFPEPLDTEASRRLPADPRLLQRWGERVWARCPPHRVGLKRVIAFFLTEYEFDGISSDEQAKWVNLLDTVLKARRKTGLVCEDRFAVGNGYLTIYVPFRRMLVCPNPNCRFWSAVAPLYDSPAANLLLRMGRDDPHVEATCPQCKRRGEWAVQDQDGDVETGVRLIRRNPHFMYPVYNEEADAFAYYYRIPDHTKAHFRTSRPELVHLDRTPWPILQAVARKTLFLFDDDAVFHAKEDTLATQPTGGLGLPRAVWNFGQLFNYFVAERQNEALGLDFLMPRRGFAPGPAAALPGGGGPLPDPLGANDGGDFRRHVLAANAAWRRDPTHVAVFPFPLTYQVFGAEDKQFAPVERLEYTAKAIHDSNQVPIELYNNSLQWQAAPMALRLHRTEHQPLVDDLDDLVAWLVRRLAKILSWEAPKARHKQTNLADSPELLGLVAQLNQAGKMPDQVLMSALGQNWQQMARARVEEVRFDRKQQLELQEEDQQLAALVAATQPPAPGQAPAGPGGQPAPAGGGGQAGPGGPAMPVSGSPVQQYLAQKGSTPPGSMEELQADAEALAAQLNALAEPVRKGELTQLNKANPTLKDAVLAAMDRQRQQVRQQAGNQAVAQMGAGPGQPAATG